MTDAAEFLPWWILFLSYLAHDSRPQAWERVKTNAPITSQSSQLNVMEYGMLLRLVAHMNRILIWYRPINIQERTKGRGFCKRKKILGCVWTFTDLFLSNLIWWQISVNSAVWMTLTFTQDHSCMKKQNVWCSFFSTIFFNKFIWNSVHCCDFLVCWRLY